VLRRCWLGDGKGIRPVKTEWWGAGVVICLELGADLHMPQLMPLPLTVSCFRKIQIGFAFLVPAHPDSPGKRAVKRVCVLVHCCYKVCWNCRVNVVSTKSAFVAAMHTFLSFEFRPHSNVAVFKLHLILHNNNSTQICNCYCFSE